MERSVGWLGAQFLSEDEVARAQAQALGVPFVLLTREDISPEALLLIPEPLSRSHGAVAYAQSGGAIEVAFVNLDVLQTIAALHPHLKIKPRLTNQASIKQALMLYQKHLKDVYGNALQAGNVEALILHALLNQASDIHLDVAPGGTRVRYRIGGVLHDAMRLTAEAGAGLVGGIKHIAKLFPIAVSQEGKFKIEKESEVVLVSVANVPAVGGEKVTMRLAPEYAGSQGFTLSALGLHGRGLEQVHAMLGMHAGLVLVAGKSESGKTTTLYTLLDHIRGAHVAVATIEDEIEYRLPHATQTQTRPELGLTMLAGLRAVLRTDPDAVLVGNLDSAETAQVALDAAARGVRVFAAIDARSSSGAIEKLLSWGLSPSLLAATMRGAVCQKLVTKLEADKKGAAEKLSREESALLEPLANFGRVLAALKDEGQVEGGISWKDVLFYKDVKPAGKIGVQEVLAITPAVKELIAQSADAAAIEEQARKEGILTMLEDALFKAATGLVSVEEALESLPVMTPQFDNVSCSQCGRSFGPGDSGFSHCRNHASIHPV